MIFKRTSLAGSPSRRSFETRGDQFESFSLAFDFQHHDLLEKFLTDPVYRALVKHPAFQRLFKIAFLGVLSFPGINTAKNTRGDHSLGVALLAYYFCRLVGFPLELERQFVISALLHDIHHLPFSHTLDFALKTEVPKFSLWEETKRIISSKPSMSQPSIADLLWQSRFTINGLPLFAEKSKQHWLFSCTHNVDTLDGISRVQSLLFSKDNSNYAQLATHIVEAFANNERYGYADKSEVNYFDQFWELKNKVYVHGIYAPNNILYERIASYYLFEVAKAKNLLTDLAFLTDQDMLCMSSDLSEKLRNLREFIGSNQYDIHDGLSGNTVDDNSNSPGTQKLIVYARWFKINKKKPFHIPNSLKKNGGRYDVLPYKWIIIVGNSFYKTVEEILGYPLIRIHSEKIAKACDDELI